MQYFDYKQTAREAKVSGESLVALERIVRRDFPHDDMMFELHVLRACMAVRDGAAKLEDVLRPDTAQKAT